MSMTHTGKPVRKSILAFLGGGVATYLGFHRELFRNLYNRVLVRTSGALFCLLFNTRARLTRKDVRVRHQGAAYHVVSGKYRIAVYPHRRANNYRYGIDRRGLSLGMDYHLPLLDFRDGDVVIDCGANVGDLKLYFEEKQIAVKYIAIEPSPMEFRCLKENVSPSEAFNVGLWNADGHLDFYVSSKGADSSLILPPSYDEVIRIPTRRLDTLANYERIKLLKVEAEGAEPEVLAGSEGILDRIDYITADLGAERGVAQTSTLAPVVNFLLARGFELVEVSHTRVTALFRNRRLAPATPPAKGLPG